MSSIETGSFAAPKPEPVHFTEAIDFIRNKTRLPTRAWTDLWQDQHSRAFVVAGAMKEALVADFHEAVTKAISQGTTLDEFRKDFDRIVSTHGWSYKGSRGWRSRVIYETNIRTSYSAGRWAQAVRLRESRPYLRYVHGHPLHPRPLHLSWHNTILPIDDPWWKTHFTPNGWGCQCTTQSVSKADMRRNGWTVSKKAPDTKLVDHRLNTPDGPVTIKVPEGIDPGFAYNPGEGAFGRGASLDAMERHGGFKPLEAPGATSTDRPLPPAQPTKTRPARPPAGETPDRSAFLSVYRQAIGGEEAIFRDPTGQHISVTDAAVDARAGRSAAARKEEASYWPFIREVIETPQEIWVGFVKDEKTGRVSMRRRYVKVVRLGNRTVTLVADEQGGFWQALAPYAVGETLSAVRKGLLAYRG